MRIILWMAISANGIIATSDGQEDFLAHENWLRFVESANRVGCLVWGRTTYEAVIKWDKSYLEELKNVKKIVLSHQKIELQEGFSLANSPEEAIQQLSNNGFQEAIITGGSTLNNEFAQRKLISEVILSVNPVLLGNGIPLFKQKDFQLDMELLSFEKTAENIIELHYRVK